jgi:hypothetical protein
MVLTGQGGAQYRTQIIYVSNIDTHDKRSVVTIASGCGVFTIHDRYKFVVIVMFQTPQWDFDASSESLYSQFIESVSEHMGCGIGYTCQVFTIYVRLGLPLSATTNRVNFQHVFVSAIISVYNKNVFIQLL